MKLATTRAAEGTRTVRVDAERAVEIGTDGGGALPAHPGWRAVADTALGRAHDPASLDHAPVVRRPDPTQFVSYIFRVLMLPPGDVVATETPGGVGYARDPRRYLTPGLVLTTAIAGVGECRNVCVRKKSA